MKLEIDRENNVAYLTLREIAAGEVAETVVVSTTTQAGVHDYQINLDLDAKGALLGIEFLDAKAGLGPLWDDEIPEPTPPTPIPIEYWESAK